MKKKNVLLQLFLSTLYLSAFTFGGGYVIVTLMKKKFVDEQRWIEEDEMLDLIAIAQSSPGAIAVNGAIVVGYKLAGVPGALISIIGTIIPPFLIISLIAFFYSAFRDNFIVSQLLEGMQAGVAAVIAAVVYEMGAGVVQGKNIVSVLIMAGAFTAACIFGVNAVYIVIVCLLIGAVRTLICEREKGGMIYLELFISFLKIGLFSFGGGYAAMPLIQDQVVTARQWLSMSEFTDLVTISQMTPGPIAINSATFVGIKIAGIPGALTATLGCILPSCVIVLLIAKLYLKYRNMDLLQGVLGSLRPAVVAMIASAGVSILITAFWGSMERISLSGTDWGLVFIFVVCVLLLRKCRMNPVLVIVLAGVAKTGLALAGI